MRLNLPIALLGLHGQDCGDRSSDFANRFTAKVLVVDRGFDLRMGMYESD